jgi:hypothetical protein
MSNEMIPSNIKLPAHVAARVGKESRLAKALNVGGGGGEIFPRISIKASRFRVVEGDSEMVLEQTKLNVIIVGANPNLSKTFYKKKWNPDAEPSAPDCFSLDGIKPDPEAEHPQNDLCASCPHNAWGSRIADNGQKLKACLDKKRLAVVAAEDPEGPMYLLEVTPAALKGLNQYQRELSMRGIPPEIVVTTVSFDTDASFPKLKFGFGGFIDEETQEIVDTLFDDPKVKQITGEERVGGNDPLEVPATKAAAIPAPQEEDEDEDEDDDDSEDDTAEEPSRGFGASKKTTKKKAAKKKVAKKKPEPEPEPEGDDEEEEDDLASEIAALLDEDDDD